MSLLLSSSLLAVILLPPPTDVILHQEVRVQFADQRTAARVLAERDTFLNQLSRFDLQSRLKTSGPVQLSDWQDLLAQQALPWQESEQKRVETILAAIRSRLEPLDLPLPETVLLIKSTGRDEGGAAYCRGTAIVLPQRMIEGPAANLERLLVHELFHVLSNQNPALRRKLYAVIGFLPCDEVPLPETLRERKITNPDGPTLDYYIRLASDQQTTRLGLPLLYARRPYDPEQGGSFFQYMEFRLLEIEQRDGNWQPKLVDGKPNLIDVQQEPSFFDQIGRNTQYIIHPDEILADNFVHLVFHTEDLPSARIIDQMRTILSRPANSDR